MYDFDVHCISDVLVERGYTESSVFIRPCPEQNRRALLRLFSSDASMNEFTCFEHSVRIRRSEKRSTGDQP